MNKTLLLSLLIAGQLTLTSGHNQAWAAESAKPGICSRLLSHVLDSLKKQGDRLEAEARSRTLTPEEIATLESRPVEELNLDMFRENPKSPAQKKMMEKIIRLFDVGYSTLAIPIAIPTVGFFALMIRKESKGPVFYIAERVGQNGEIIKVPKLRTMRTKEELANMPNAAKILDGTSTQENDPRIAGKWAIRARKFKVDELPQLLNVLKGEMAISGSRPLDKKESDKIQQKIPGWDLRYEKKPGLANKAQAILPHSDNIDTEKGVALRKEKFHMEIGEDAKSEQNPVVEMHKTIFLVIRAIIIGRGGQNQ